MLAMVFAAAVMTIVADPAHAQVRTAVFPDATGGTWTTGAHWSGGVAPGAGNNAIVGTTGETPRTMNIVSGPASLAANVLIGNFNGAGGTVFMSGGAMTIGGNLAVGNVSGGTGHFEMTGGSMSIGAQLRVGATAGTNGQFILNGGTVTAATVNYNTSVANGNMSMLAGQLAATNFNIATGTNTSGTFEHSGGTIVITTGALSIGSGSNATGVYNLNSGAALDLSGATVDLTLGSATGTGMINFGAGTSITIGRDFFFQNGHLALDSTQITGVGRNLGLASAASSSASMTLTPGQNFTIGGAFNIATGNTGSAGTFSQSGGTVTILSNLALGSGSAASGVLNLTDNAVIDLAGAASDLLVGSATGMGTLNIEDGSRIINARDVAFRNGEYTFDVSKITHANRTLSVADVTSSSASLVMTPGQSFTVGGALEIATATNSAGAFTQTGGTVTLLGTLFVGSGAGATGVLNLTDNAVINLAGATSDLTVGSATGMGTLNIEDGSRIINARDVNFRNGDYTFDLNKITDVNPIFGVANIANANANASVVLTAGQNLNAGTTLNIATETNSIGTFTQTGGTVTTTAVNIGAGTNSNGSYYLGGSGVLKTNTTSGHIILGGVTGMGDLIIEDGSQIDVGGDLILYNGSYTIDSEKIIGIGRNISVGSATNTKGNLTLINHNQSLNVTTAVNIGTGNLSAATFNQQGGTLSLSTILSIGTGGTSNGLYNMTNGGVVSVGTNVAISSTGNNGTGELNLGDGTLVFNRNSATAGQLLLGGNTGHATMTLAGGTVIRGGTGAGIINARLRDNSASSAVIHGTGAFVNMGGTFINNGVVLADGGAMDLSSFNIIDQNEAVSLTLLDGRQAGWYARNGGHVILPTITGVGANDSVSWGETQADSSLDLVNSFRASFLNLDSGGNLQASFLASDHSMLPNTTTGTIIGLWDIQALSGLDFGNSGQVDLTFRYDDALLSLLGFASSDLDVYFYDTGLASWVAVTDGLASATTINTLSLDALGLFAVGVNVMTVQEPQPQPQPQPQPNPQPGPQPGGDGTIPEPATAMMLGVGLSMLMRRTRRR